MNNKNQHQGFTLIEVLLVIGIIAILAAVVIIAINPARQLAQARNTQRWSNINTILNAAHQYSIDNKGNVMASISSSTLTEICATSIATATCTGASLTDATPLWNNELYITSLPKDPGCPTGCNASGIGYRIKKSANGRITVDAPGAELGETISVTR